MASAAFFAQAGNVGINTTSPGTTLDVNGAITNRETIAPVSANAVTVPANVSQVQLSGAATANVTITAPGAPNAGQRLVVFNNTTGGFGATLNGVTITNGKALEFVYSNSGWRSTDGGSLGATPVNIYTADGTLSGNRTVTQNANTLSFTGTAVNAFSVAGNTLSVDAANGRLGIGTTAPDTKLTINTPDGNFGIHHTNGTISLKSFIGSGAGWIGTTTPHDLRLESNNVSRIAISGNTGNVGINTTTPSAKLDIRNNDAAIPSLMVENLQTQPTTANAAFLTIDNTTGEFYKGQQADKVFYYQKYTLNNVQGDYISNFDTKISTSGYTLIIVGSYFDQLLAVDIGNTSRNRFTPQNVYAFQQGGTWRITADFPATSSLGNGQTVVGNPNGSWTIYTMIIRQNQVVNNTDVTVNFAGANNSSAPVSPVP
ncbi:hypothetical protein C1634_024510 [Chryseobacterium viscerum]|uniref:Uncharacterized protein n=2 Tax=Chryseobacterium viscerum TaxID=1037377 RepID=A0A316WB08_9FLAO|nr:hypothetical protein C1634_024510 [Chryseobacterium viscerum]